MRFRWRWRSSAGWVAADVEDVADDRGRNDRADAVDLRQRAATGFDQGVDLDPQLGELLGEGQHPVEPPPSHRGPDAVVAAQQLQCCVQVRHVGQVRQLALVAGPQPQQVGVDPVRGRSPLDHQLVPVLGQHPEIGGVAGHRSDRCARMARGR